MIIQPYDNIVSVFQQRIWTWMWRGRTTCWVTWSGAPAVWATQGTSEVACAAAVATRATPAPACSACRTLRRRPSSWAAAYRQHWSLTQLTTTPPPPQSHPKIVSPLPSLPASLPASLPPTLPGPTKSKASPPARPLRTSYPHSDFHTDCNTSKTAAHIQHIISGQSLGCHPLCSAPIKRGF